MGKYTYIAALLIVALLLSGCVLPVPHRRMHSAGIGGKVVDAKTHSPVPGAKVSGSDEGGVLSVTDSRGRFEIPSQYGWHGAYLIGPISYSLLPHFDMPYPHPPFRVDAAGYDSATIQPYGELQNDEDTGQAVFELRPQ